MISLLQNLINNYNLHFDGKILTAEQFEDSLRQSVCIQEWEIDVVDQFIPGVDMCDDGRVMRVYQIYNQETPYPLDTAILILKNVLFESILLPEDVDNIACGDQVDPLSLQSVPSLIVGHDTVALGGEWTETTSASFCNFGVTYVDEVISEQCIWGAKKIMRTWDFGDWCSNVSQRHTQFLYIIDREALW